MSRRRGTKIKSISEAGPHIPNEIMQRIYAKVSDQSTMSRLAQCNKYLNERFNKQVYHVIDLRAPGAMARLVRYDETSAEHRYARKVMVGRGNMIYRHTVIIRINDRMLGSAALNSSMASWMRVLRRTSIAQFPVIDLHRMRSDLNDGLADIKGRILDGWSSDKRTLLDRSTKGSEEISLFLSSGNPLRPTMTAVGTVSMYIVCDFIQAYHRCMIDRNHKEETKLAAIFDFSAIPGRDAPTMRLTYTVSSLEYLPWHTKRSHETKIALKSTRHTTAEIKSLFSDTPYGGIRAEWRIFSTDSPDTEQCDMWE